MSVLYYRCPRCGWVHAARRAAHLRYEAGSDEVYQRHLRCFNCKTPTDTFVPAQLSEAPPGTLIYSVVVPGIVFEESPQINDLTARLAVVCIRKRAELGQQGFDDYLQELDARLQTHGLGVTPEEAVEVMKRLRLALSDDKMRDDLDYERHLKALKAAVQVGLADSTAGRYTDFNSSESLTTRLKLLASEPGDDNLETK